MSASREALNEAIRRTQDYFLRTQHPSGYWLGDLDSNVCMAAQYLLLTHFLGLRDDGLPDGRWRKVANYLRREQRADGTWAIYHGGPPDLNATVESYFALKLAGVSPDDPAMARAREWTFAAGGVPKVRVFTKIWLALFGQWDWQGVPVLPPEMILLPRWAPLNIYDFAAWARATIVPMLIILSERPTCPVPDSARIDELFPGGREGTDYGLPAPQDSRWGTFFHRAEDLLRRAEPLLFGGSGFSLTPARSIRAAAYRVAEDWIVAHQEADGTWAGIQPPWVYSLIALKVRGYPLDHPVMRRGLEAFESGWAIEDDETFNPQACVSPVWDTVLAMNALLDSGLAPDHPALVHAAHWLLSKQVLTGGDWQVGAPDVEPGGWSFEFENDFYPDTDDTAEALIALSRVRLPDERRKDEAIKRGRRWLIGMQSANGGWGAFDRDNTRRMVSKIPFCDFGEVIDAPSEDVTAHVIEALALVGDGGSGAVRRGLRYLRSEHREDGSWFGRWGVNYVAGTGSVLPAFKASGCDMTKRRFQRAAGWLTASQNADGGWGEDPRSYVDESWVGRGDSTPSQTAWGMAGLLAVDGDDAIADSLERGAQWLIERQEEDGQWLEPQSTATGFPGDFYLRYDLYRNYWPLLTLGRYRDALGPA